MTEVQLGWVAGIIDGEGCISVERHSTKTDRLVAGHVVVVTVRNTDHLMLATLQSLCGGTVREVLSRSTVILGRKRIWAWRVTSLEARSFLRVVGPHLVAKREQAQTALSLPYKADRRPRSTEFIEASEATRAELMRLHHNPHCPLEELTRAS